MKFQHNSSPDLQIGRTVPRADAVEKVRGETKYAADYYGRPALWAGVKRSDVAHAEVIRIDTEAARRVDGVTAVLTYSDVKGTNRQGIVHKNQPVLVEDRIRRIGDPLVLILAEDKVALKKAVEAVVVETKPLPAVFDPFEAAAPSSPLIHEESPGNILAEVLVEKGRGREALAQCAVVVSDAYTLPRQAHAYLETESGWAYIDPAGRLNLIASTQSPFRDRTETAEALGLPVEGVRVVAPFLGGGFGGKDGLNVQALLGLAALHSRGMPVKMWWDREENFLAGVKRFPAHIEYRLGADSDGRFLALDCEIIMDAGAYDHLGGEVLALCAEHAGGAYRIPNVRIHGRCVYTNNPPSGPFRGFGVPQITAAVEQVVDGLAAKLKQDRLEIRKKNALRRGDTNAVGVGLIYSTGVAECLDEVCRHPLWREREDWKKKAERFKRRGVGLVCLAHGAGYGPIIPDEGNARIEITGEGRFRVDAAVSDMGQGNASACVQIAGAILNQPPDSFELVLPDTDQTLPSGSSTASRTTYTYANALIRAAQTMKARLLEKAWNLLEVPAGEHVEIGPGFVRHSETGREIDLAAIAGRMTPEERTATGYWRAPVARDKINAELKSVFGIPHVIFSYAAHVALVELDELTGKIDVKQYLAVTESGRVLNPQVFEQQIQGGVVQGMGYALSEDYSVREGRGEQLDFSTYIIPTTLDAPDMDSIAVQMEEPTGPFGLKGVGEIPINGPLPAIANAVADACGVRIMNPPFTPEKLLAAINREMVSE